MGKKIKRLRVVRYDLSRPDADISSGGTKEQLMSDTEYEGRWGKVICEKQYGAEGLLEQQTEYEYNDQGFLTREIIREADGEIMNDRSWEPDSQGRVLREYHHYADGSKDSIDYKYDESGRLIMKTLTDEDEDVEHCEIFEYDSEGLLIRESVYYDDAALVVSGRQGEAEQEKVYKYADHLLIEFNERDTPGGLVRRRVNEFDENGRRIKMTVFDENDQPVERVSFVPDGEGRPVEVIEETRKKKNTLKMEYTSQGNVAFQEEYDMHGNLLNRIERSYDDEGRVDESRALVNNPVHGVRRQYIVKHHYEFFE